KGMPSPRANPAHPMPDVDPVEPATPSDGAEPGGEEHEPPLYASHHLRSGLRARALLHEHELATLVVRPRPVEEDEQLKGERHLAIEILMQAVVPAGAVLEEERRRPRLSVRRAARQELLQRIRVALPAPQRLHPAVRDRHEMPVRALAQRSDERWQGIREV